MLDMRELVPEHARNLVVIECAHQPRCHGDCCIGGVAPRRKGIRCILVNDVDARHWKPRTSREFLHKAVKFRRALTVNLLCIIHAEHHAVREPVGEEVHAERNDEHDGHARVSGEYAAKGDHESHQQRHEHRCLK